MIRSIIKKIYVHVVIFCFLSPVLCCMTDSFTICSSDKQLVKIPLEHALQSDLLKGWYSTCKLQEWSFDYSDLRQPIVAIGKSLSEKSFTQEEAIKKFAVVLKEFDRLKQTTPDQKKLSAALTHYISEQPFDDLLVLAPLGEYFAVEELVHLIPAALCKKLYGFTLENVCKDKPLFEDFTQLPAASITQNFKVSLLLKNYKIFNAIFKNLIESDEVSGTFKAPIIQLAFHTTKPYLAALTSDNILHIINTNDKIVIFSSKDPASIETAVISSDCRFIAAAGTNNIITWWDAQTPEDIYASQGHDDTIVSLEFAQDDTRLISTNLDNIQHTWNTATREEVGEPITLSQEDAARIKKQYMPVSNRLLWRDKDLLIRIIQNDKSHVHLIDTQMPRNSAVLKGHTETINALSTHQKNMLIATGSDDNTVRLWNLSRLQKLVDTINLDGILLICYLAKNSTSSLRDYPHLKKALSNIINLDWDLSTN